MSKQIDERVVSMQFDNKKFESNVKTTMGTLDKLKEKLKFTDSYKGLENIGTAANKVHTPMSTLGSSVETVRAKFTALEIMGITALTNITNSAINAGKRIVKALTVEPISDGFKEYELMLNAIQTTMAGTGKTAKEVEEELKKLDDYADKTVYSTSDMLNNLPKFTNAGVELEVATEAMIGIANATALAGGDANKAAIAFYNLGQSIGTGYLSRMDYNSINNAGIATQEWKKQIVETAVAMGTLEQVNEDLYDIGGKTFSLQQLFIDGLQHQWATSDVLLKVFGDYGNETTKIGKKAYAAAQDIKTYTQMMESLKATAGTGWKDTWQIIFGDLDKAKVFWTGLTNAVSSVLDKTANFRNSVLETALNNPFTKLLDKIEKINSTTKKSIDSMKNLGEVVNRVIRGDFGNQWDNGDPNYRAKKLTEAGYDYATVQNLVNEKLGCSVRLTSTLTEKQSKLNKEQKTSIDQLLKKTDKQLEALGLTKEEVKLLRELEAEAKKSNISVEELIKSMGDMDGRTMLIESFKNVSEGLVTVLKSVKEAFLDAFPISATSLALKLNSAIQLLYEFSKKLNISEKEETIDKLTRTLKGLFAILDIITTIVGGPAKIAFKLLGQLMSVFHIDILDVTAKLGDTIVKFRDWVDSVLDFTGVFEKLVPYVDKAKDAITKWIEATKPLEKIAKLFEDVADAISKFAKTVVDSEIGQNIIDGIANGLKGGAGKIWDAIVAIAKGMLEKIKSVLGIHSPSTEFEEVGENAMAGLANGLKNGVTSIGDIIKSLCSKIFKIFGDYDWTQISTLFVNLSKVFPQLKFLNVLSGLGGLFTFAGSDVISGLINGLANGAEVVWNAITLIATKLITAFKNVLGIHSPSTVFFALGGFIIAGLLGGIMAEAPTITDGLKDIGSRMVEFFSGLDLGTVIVAGLGIGTLFMVKQMIDVLGKFGDAAKGIGKLTSSLSGLIDTVNNGVMGKFVKTESKWTTISKAIQRVAISIGILVGSVYLLSTVLDDKDGGKKLGTAILALAGIMVLMGGLVAGLMAADKYLSKKGSDLGKTANAILKIAAAIAVMALIAKMLGSMDANVLKQGMTAISGFVVIIGILMAATKLLNGSSNVGKIGGTLMKVAGAILIMGLVARLLGSMDQTALNQGMVAIEYFVLIIATLMAATRFLTGSTNVDKIGGTLIKIAAAIGIMALVVKLLGTMDEAALKQGIIMIGVFSGIIVGLMAATKILNGSSNVGKIGGSIFKIAAAIGIMALVTKLLGSMDENVLKKGIVMISVFSGIIVGLMAATKLINGSKNVDSIGGAILKIAAAIGLMAAVIAILGLMKPEHLAKGTIVVTLLAGIIVGLMAATKLLTGSKNVDKIGNTVLNVAKAIALMAVAVALLALIKPDRLAVATACMTAITGIFGLAIYAAKDAKKCLGSIIAMTAAITVIAVLLWKLSELPAENTVGAAIALSITLSAMSLALKALGGIKKAPWSAIGALAVLGLVVAEIAVILAVISKLNISLDSVLTISALLVVMSGVLFVLNKMPKAPWSALGALAVLGLVVAEIAVILGLISHFNIGASVDTMVSISALLVVMTGVLAALSIIGPMAGSAFVGIGALAVLGLVVAELAIILAVIEHFNLAPSIETVKSLSILLLSMSGVLLALSVVGVMGPAAFIGMGALATLIVGLGALLVGIGALVNEFPAIETFLDKGIPILEKLGYALGSFFGNILGGFLGGITSGLPQIGTDLSMFMMNAIPFIMGSKLIDEACMNGVKALAEAILIISAANVVEGIASWITGSSSIETFGAQLVPFAKYMVEFSSIISGNIDEGAIMAAGNAGKALAEMADTVPKMGGVVQWFSGTTNLETFGTQLKTFGEAIVAFSGIVGGNISESAITAAANAGKTIAEMADTVPKWGGVVGWFTGTTDLDTFSTQLKTFGEAMVEFSGTIAGNINYDSVTAAANAGKMLSELATNLPNSGGIKSWWEGDNTLSDFAKEIVDFADELTKLDTSGMEALGSLNDSLAELATTAITDFANTITNSKETIVKVAETLMSNFITGMTNKEESVKKSAESLGKKASNAFGSESNVDAAKSSGKDLGSGLVKGIKAKETSVYNAAYALGQMAVQGEKDGQESASPSKATIRAGKWLGEGLIIGMQKMTGKVYSAGSDLGESATDTMSSVISKITDFINSDIESQPTIRPVLDLSSVQSGANSISSMLSGRRTLSINTASIGSISESMNRNQNRVTSSDVVSAIKGLRSDMANMPRNTYSINGITYDDGTNVADAVRTLVRAARIERRV